MSQIYACDRCGKQSKDPKTEGWVTHWILDPAHFGRPFDDVLSDKLNQTNDLCRGCRNAFDDWMKVRLAEAER